MPKIKRAWNRIVGRRLIEPCNPNKWNLYRLTATMLIDGDGDGLADVYPRCLQPDLMSPTATDNHTPPSGETDYYLVTAENSVGESSLGYNSSGLERPSVNPCP